MREQNLQWWKADKGEVYQTLVPLVNKLREEQVERVNDAVRYLDLYEGNPAVKRAYGGSYPMLMPQGVSDPEAVASVPPIHLNVIESVCDTAVAKNCKTRIAPMFDTVRGNFRQQRQAKQLDAMMDGQFHSERVYELMEDSNTDATIYGTGAIKVVPSYSREKCIYEPAYMWELFADNLDGQKRRPMNFFQRTSASKTALLEDFKGSKADYAIEHAPAVRSDARSMEVSDHILVIESWRRAVGSTKGRHVISIEGADLVDEPWPFEVFPFAFVHWKRRRLGIWGKGIAAIDEPVQKEIDRLLLSIQDGQSKLGKTYIQAPPGFNDAQVDDQHGTIMVTAEDGRGLSFHTPQILQPEIYNHLWALYQKAYELPGISMMSASSVIPAGLEGSGKAQEVHHQIESERLGGNARSLEDMTVQLSDLTLMAWEMLKEANVNVRVRSAGKRRGFVELNYEQLRENRENFVTRTYPSSAMRNDPVGRLSDIERLKNVGVITDPSRMRQLLGWPDLDSDVDVGEASREFTQKQIDSILVDLTMEGVDDETWEAPQPDPMQLLGPAIEQVQGAYLEAQSMFDAAAATDDDRDLHEMRMNLLREYSVALKEELDKAQTPPPAGPPPGSGEPPAPEQGADNMPPAPPAGM